MKVEGMEIGCAEKCFFIIIWGLHQSLMSLFQEDTECRAVELSSEFGSLAVWLWLAGDEVYIAMRQIWEVYVSTKTWVRNFFLTKPAFFRISLAVAMKKRAMNDKIFFEGFSPKVRNFFQMYKVINITEKKLFYLFRNFSMTKKFQCHYLQGRLVVKNCFSNVTPDCNGLADCCMVFRLNCKNAQEKYAAW